MKKLRVREGKEDTHPNLHSKLGRRLGPKASWFLLNLPDSSIN